MSDVSEHNSNAENTALENAFHGINQPNSQSEDNNDDNYDINITELDKRFIPVEPIYDRSKMRNLVTVNYTFTLDEVNDYIALNDLILEDYFLAENTKCARCLIFYHNISIDDGGLAKEWFTRNYTSSEILKFICGLSGYDDVFIEGGKYLNFMVYVKQIILLGYTNFRWLYISNDLMDLLYISYKFHNSRGSYNFESNSNINSDSESDEVQNLFKMYLENIANNKIDTDFEKLEVVPKKLKKMVEYMTKKIKNEYDLEQNSYINRIHLTAYLYYKEYENAKENNLEEKIQKYYLLKMVITLYQSVEIFMEQIKYIDENLNIDTVDNLINAIKIRISNEIPFETFLEINSEIIYVLNNFLPDIKSMDSAYTEFRSDTYPEFLKNNTKQLLYAHLINNNEFIDINKLLRAIEFSNNNLVFTNTEKNKILNVIRSMNNNELLNFLKYITGTDRIPPSIKIYKTHTERLASHTCTNQLEFPEDFITINDNETIKVALTAELTSNDFTIAGGGITENNSMSNTLNSIFLAGIILVSSILQGM